MGRFFRTTSANPMDYMYQINTPLMEKVLTTNDAYITENIDVAQKLGDLANYTHLQGDEEDAMAITNEYVKQVNDITNSIKKDPSNWRKYSPLVTSLKDKLKQDYTTGAISKQIANYNKRAQDFAAIDEQVKLYNTSGGSKGTNPYDAMLMKAHLDKKFTKTGYDAKTGNYNPYVGGSFMSDMDIKGELSKGIDKMKASGQIVEHPTQKGMYLIETEQGYKGVTPERVMQAMKGNFSPQLMNYLKERSDIGSVSGVFQTEDILNDKGEVVAKKGDFINPYDVPLKPPTAEETAELKLRQAEIDKLTSKDKNSQKAKELQEKLNDDAEALATKRELVWNNKNPLSSIMQGIISENAWMETTNRTKLKADPVALPVWRQQQANANAAAARAVTVSEGKLNRESREKMAEASLKYRKEKDVADRIAKIKADTKLKPEEKNALISVEQEVDEFIKDPKLAFDPSDMADKSKQYADMLRQQQQNPNSLTVQQREDLQQLDLLFGGIAKNLNITPQQLKEVVAFNNGDMFGSVKKTKQSVISGGTAAGSGQESTYTDYTYKYREVAALAEKLLKNEKAKKSSIKDLAGVLAANTSIDELAYAPSRNTKEGTFTLDLVDKLFNEKTIGRNYYKAGETYYDKNGNLKKSNYVGEIDTPIFGTSDKEAGRDPLGYLVATRGGKPTDYLKNIKVKMDGNKLVVSGDLTVGNSKNTSFWVDDIDDDDIEGDAKKFQVVFDDFESGIKEIYGNSKTFRNSPSGQAFLDKTGDRVSIADKRVNKAIGYLLNPGQKQEIAGTIFERTNEGFKYSEDKGKTWHSTIGLRDNSNNYMEVPLTSVDQIKKIVEDNL